MSEQTGDLEKRVCEELFWLWKTIDFAKQAVREMQDKKLIIDEDYADMMEALERAEKKTWEMKVKYGCVR